MFKNSCHQAIDLHVDSATTDAKSIADNYSMQVSVHAGTCACFNRERQLYLLLLSGLGWTLSSQKHEQRSEIRTLMRQSLPHVNGAISIACLNEPVLAE